MKDYVKIQSKKTINVTDGLPYQNFTKKDSDIPNRMKIAPVWPKKTILIKEGTHFYPSEVVEFDSVKKLEKLEVLTIDTRDYTIDDVTQAEKAECLKMKKKVAKPTDTKKEIKRTTKKESIVKEEKLEDKE